MKKFVIYLIYVAGFVCGQLWADEATSADKYDHFVGWYMLGDNAQIPVLKIDGEYYTACRGFEMPLERYHGELKWKLGVSSMVGTMIGKDAEKDQYYIVIKDSKRQAAEEQTPETVAKNGFKLGEKAPLTKIDDPKYILDAKADEPGKNEDFIGYYVPSLFAYIRMEITLRDDKYFMIQKRFSPNGGWENDGKEVEIKSLQEGIGFSMNEKSSFVYNKSLKRYEMVLKAPGVGDIKMPLARVEAEFAVDSDSLKIMTGVPSWF